MKPHRAVLLVAAAGCQQTLPELPWVRGLDNAVVSTGIDVPRAVADPAIAPGCGAGASRPIELVADVAPSPGRELVVASYSGGIAVFDREDHVLAETPGYPCEGTADELEVVAVGTAYRERILAIAATTGGRREAVTWVGLFRPGATLEPVFTGVVETRTDGVVERGLIYLVPDGLIYQRPGGVPHLWELDPGSRIYVPTLPETPHDEPPTVSLLSGR